MSKEKEEDETTFSEIYTDNWEPEESTIETAIETTEDTRRKRPDGGVNTTINTDVVEKNTVVVCSRCGSKSYLANGKCVRCNYHLV